MATNKPVGDNQRKGAIKNRIQVLNPRTKIWTKIDRETGKFLDGKQDGTPFKGVTKK